QRVDRKPFQIIQRRITRAEIVYRDLDSHQLQLVQLLDRLLGILHDRTLRELELEPARVEIRVFEYLRNIRDERRLLELTRRKIHRQSHRSEPRILHALFCAHAMRNTQSPNEIMTP